MNALVADCDPTWAGGWGCAEIGDFRTLVSRVCRWTQFSPPLTSSGNRIGNSTVKARSYFVLLIVGLSVILVVSERSSLNQRLGYGAQRPFVVEITYRSGDLQIEWFGRSEYQSRLTWFDDGHGNQVLARWEFNPFRPLGEGLLHHSWRFGITPQARDGAIAAPVWAFVACLFMILTSIAQAIRFAKRRTKFTNHGAFEVISERPA